MNRHFAFSSAQLKLVIFLAGVLVILSGYRLVRSYATADDEAFRFAFQAGDQDYRYNPVFRVDLNHSPADSLELIPGIGPVFSERIVAYRDSAGGFDRIEDIMQVKGIGYGTFEKIRGYLEVRPW